RQAAETFAAPYVLTSALTGEFVEDAFNALAIEMVTRAFRQEDTRAAERGLRQKALVLLDKRGSVGLKKHQFFEILRGVKVDELQAELDRLEREGLVTILWYGASDFAVTITGRGDIAGRSVVDLGCGNGVLAIAAKLSGAARVLGVDADLESIEVSRRNAEHSEVEVEWDVADVSSVHEPFDTVLMNPPFGAQT